MTDTPKPSAWLLHSPSGNPIHAVGPHHTREEAERSIQRYGLDAVPVEYVRLDAARELLARELEEWAKQPNSPAPHGTIIAARRLRTGGEG